MIHYKIMQNGAEKGIVSLDAFRFYHPKRKRMFMTTSLKEAQYIILDGAYYKISSLGIKEHPDVKGKYPKIDLILTSQEEYEKYMKEKEKVFSDEK